MKLNVLLIIFFACVCNQTYAQTVSTLINDSTRTFESIHWHEDGRIYVSDYNNGRLYQLDISGNIQTILQGYSSVAGGGFDNTGQFFFSDLIDSSVYLLNSNNTASLIVDGLDQPVAVLPTSYQDTLYVVQYGDNSIAKISVSTGQKLTWATHNGFNGPDALLYKEANEMLCANFNNTNIFKVDTFGNVTSFASLPTGGLMGYLTISDSIIYVPSLTGHRIYKIDLNGIVSTFAGSALGGNNDGLYNEARFNAPNGICSSPNGDTLLITDGNKIRMIVDLNGLAANTISYPTKVRLNIYPNPSTDNLTVAFNTANNSPLKWIIYSIDGQIVSKGLLIKQDDSLSNATIDIQNLPEGMFVIKLFSDQSFFASKQFVKNKG